MLDIEHGVNGKIVPLVRRHAQPAQSLVHVAGSRRSRHFNDAERAYGVIRVAAVACERDHGVPERERFGNHGIRRRRKPEIIGKTCEHRSVHPFAGPAPHLIPEIARHLELGLNRHLELRQREQIFESGLAGHLLQQEPPHLFGGSRGRKPWKKRITLPRAGLPKPFEPGDEPIHLGGDVGSERGDRASERFNESDLCVDDQRLAHGLVRRRFFRKARLESERVILGQFGLKCRKTRSAEFSGPPGPFKTLVTHNTISSRDIDRHADNGDAVGAIIGRMLEFFAEYVRIDFFVADANILGC